MKKISILIKQHTRCIIILRQGNFWEQRATLLRLTLHHQELLKKRPGLSTFCTQSVIQQLLKQRDSFIYYTYILTLYSWHWVPNSGASACMELHMETTIGCMTHFSTTVMQRSFLGPSTLWRWIQYQMLQKLPLSPLLGVDASEFKWFHEIMSKKSSKTIYK